MAEQRVLCLQGWVCFYLHSDWNKNNSVSEHLVKTQQGSGCSLISFPSNISHSIVRSLSHYFRMVGQILPWCVVRCLQMRCLGGCEPASSQDREYRHVLHHRCEFKPCWWSWRRTGCRNAHKILLKLWLYFQVQNTWSPLAKPVSLTGQKLLAASVPQADQEGKRGIKENPYWTCQRKLLLWFASLGIMFIL